MQLSKWRPNLSLQTERLTATAERGVDRPRVECQGKFVF